MSFIECPRPHSGCKTSYHVYHNVDCDGDGILDHACFNTFSGKRYLILSSEGCVGGRQKQWQWHVSRSVSECRHAFQQVTEKIPFVVQGDIISLY